MDNILHQFDYTMLEKFSELPNTRTKLSGRSVDYKNVEDIWRFKLDKLEVKDEYFRETSDACLLLSRSATQNPIEVEPT